MVVEEERNPMALLSKIALALAFLAAFAIPWLGATAKGSITPTGTQLFAAAKAGLAEEEMEPAEDTPQGGVEAEEGVEFEDDLYLDEEEPMEGEPMEPLESEPMEEPAAGHGHHGGGR